MAYVLRLTPRFEKNFRRLTKKDHVLMDRVYNKLSEILENPSIGELLSQNLAGMLSTHIGNWVIIYMIDGDEIVLLNFDHHDRAYFRSL